LWSDITLKYPGYTFPSDGSPNGLSEIVGFDPSFYDNSLIWYCYNIDDWINFGIRTPIAGTEDLAVYGPATINLDGGTYVYKNIFITTLFGPVTVNGPGVLVAAGDGFSGGKIDLEVADVNFGSDIFFISSDYININNPGYNGTSTFSPRTTFIAEGQINYTNYGPQAFYAPPSPTPPASQDMILYSRTGDIQFRSNSSIPAAYFIGSAIAPNGTVSFDDMLSKFSGADLFTSIYTYFNGIILANTVAIRNPDFHFSGSIVTNQFMETPGDYAIYGGTFDGTDTMSAIPTLPFGFSWLEPASAGTYIPLNDGHDFAQKKRNQLYFYQGPWYPGFREMY